MRIKINKNLSLYSINSSYMMNNGWSSFLINLEKNTILIIDAIPTMEYYPYFLGGYEFHISRKDADEINESDSLINLNNNKPMNIKEKLILLVTPEPEKSRRKVGITDGDDYPTDEGVKAVISWWLKNSPDAKKFDEEVVKPLTEEIEKDNK